MIGLEQHYETDENAGALSIREIAKQHGVSDTAIRKRARSNAWTRDLTARVQEQVRTELVRTSVRTATPQTEQAIVEEAAAQVVAVVREHRQDIGNLRGLADTLAGQTSDASGSPQRSSVQAFCIKTTRSGAKRSVSYPKRTWRSPNIWKLWASRRSTMSTKAVSDNRSIPRATWQR